MTTHTDAQRADTAERIARRLKRENMALRLQVSVNSGVVAAQAAQIAKLKEQLLISLGRTGGV